MTQNLRWLIPLILNVVVVLIISSCYPSPVAPADGVFIRTQAEALAASGATVEVVAAVPWVPPGLSRWRTRWAKYQRTPRRYTLNGIVVHRPRYFAPPASQLWLRPHRSILRCAKRHLRHDTEIVHGHFAYPDGLAAVELGCHVDLPSVVTLHGSDTNVFPDRSPVLRKRFIRTVRSAGAVLAVSNALADKAESIATRRPRVHGIGLNLAKFANLPTRAEARQALALDPRKPLLLFVGHLLAAKGLRELLQSLEALRSTGISCVFVGDGSMRAEIEAASNAIARGIEPNERIPLYMRAADALVLPSHSEGMPTVVIEAGAAGLPVIASDVGGIPETLGSERGWVVPARVVPALTQAIRGVLNDRAEARRRAARLMEFVHERFDAKRTAQSLLELYRSMEPKAGFAEAI